MAHHRCGAGRSRDDRSPGAWPQGAGYAPRTLARRFAAETGFGLAEWRALHAIEMLADGLAVTTIAIDLGYDNVSVFIATFRRTMGVTPGRCIRSQVGDE